METDPAYIEVIDAWHIQREARLKSETGWLTLVGLFPLEGGENTFGSAEDNDLVFPEAAPEHAGTFRVDSTGVHLVVAPGVVVMHDSEAVQAIALVDDSEGEPTVCDMGRFQFYIIGRGGRPYVRLKDRECEALKNFSGIERFPVDPKWRIEATWEPYDPPRSVMTPSIMGYETEEWCPGAAVFDVGGTTVRLEPTGDPAEGLFFVFGDATNEHETYGGGRFLYTDPPDSNGVVVLDFNKCYNPPCVFSPFATCPLPRDANRLAVRIEAGEKMYHGAGH